MKTEIFAAASNSLTKYDELIKLSNTYVPRKGSYLNIDDKEETLPEILFITSYPPRECGIATYSQDLMNAIREKFGKTFSLKVCALEGRDATHQYTDEVKYTLQSSEPEQYDNLAKIINQDKNLAMIFIQHEFGLYGGNYGEYLLQFLSIINKPVITTFHTILPNPDIDRKKVVRSIVSLSASIVAMTKNSADILETDYAVPSEKIVVIQHGTHLVSPDNLTEKKTKHNFGNRIILSTFGLLSSGKSIETALDALPAIAAAFPNVLYLIIGKTHPGVIKNEGEKYREFLYEKVTALNLQNNVKFINKYLSLEALLDYLQLTDIYLFTSKNPHQAVSGTFAYAMSCGCPVISTPIPHAKETLDGAGLIVDFQNAEQLSVATISLLSNPKLMEEMRLNALHKINPTAWQNSAISHINLCMKHISPKNIKLSFEIPEISLAHIKRMTTHKGMLQFCSISMPDMASGYTLDDNARALIALTKHFKLTAKNADLFMIDTYLGFICFCQQPNGQFLNYVDINGNYFAKNNDENLEDSNGRAIWALGEFISNKKLFFNHFTDRAVLALEKSLEHIPRFHSPRAIAFAIKGLYHYNLVKNDSKIKQMITGLADNLVSKYRGVSGADWKWYEEYLTYANSVLPESMLYAYLCTGNELFKNIARSSFDFLLSVIFQEEGIKVVSNKGWHMKGKASNKFGEQPIDVSYSILALDLFYETFKDELYLNKIETAFNWFLGKNHQHQVIYNPCTGGCYDGLEENHINLNQGAESTVSYLMSRLVVEKYFNHEQKKKFSPLLVPQTGFMI